MTDIFSHIRKASPAVIMAAGTVPMVASDAPDHVKYGGACLMAIAAMLVDLQSSKKIGYSDKIVNAVRKIPGLENADEGTVLGTLTFAACGFLGGGAAMNMAENGVSLPEAIKLGVNTVSYPLSGAIDFKRSRLWLENSFGKEIRFKYKDDKGTGPVTKSISTSSLLQQFALFSGAMGIFTYGYNLDALDIQFTGAMFALSNGMNINKLFNERSDAVLTKMEALKDKIASGDTGEALRQEWNNTKKAFARDVVPMTPPMEVDVATLKKVAEAVEPVNAELNMRQEKGKGR